jgi:hypothetical protein
MYLQLRYACISFNIRIGKGQHGYWNDVDKSSLYHFYLGMEYCYKEFLDLLVEGLTAARTLNKLTLSARINANACATFSSFMRSNVANISLRELCVNIPEDRHVEMDTMIASIFAEPAKHNIASSLLALEITRLKQAELFFSNLSASGSAIQLQVLRLGRWIQ